MLAFTLKKSEVLKTTNKSIPPAEVKHKATFQEYKRMDTYGEIVEGRFVPITVECPIYDYTIDRFEYLWLQYALKIASIPNDVMINLNCLELRVPDDMKVIACTLEFDGAEYGYAKHESPIRFFTQDVFIQNNISETDAVDCTAELLINVYCEPLLELVQQVLPELVLPQSPQELVQQVSQETTQQHLEPQTLQQQLEHQLDEQVAPILQNLSTTTVLDPLLSNSLPKIVLDPLLTNSLPKLVLEPLRQELVQQVPQPKLSIHATKLDEKQLSILTPLAWTSPNSKLVGLPFLHDKHNTLVMDFDDMTIAYPNTIKFEYDKDMPIRYPEVECNMDLFE